MPNERIVPHKWIHTLDVRLPSQHEIIESLLSHKKIHVQTETDGDFEGIVTTYDTSKLSATRLLGAKGRRPNPSISIAIVSRVAGLDPKDMLVPYRGTHHPTKNTAKLSIVYDETAIML